MKLPLKPNFYTKTNSVGSWLAEGHDQNLKNTVYLSLYFFKAVTALKLACWVQPCGIELPALLLLRNVQRSNPGFSCTGSVCVFLWHCYCENSDDGDCSCLTVYEYLRPVNIQRQDFHPDPPCGWKKLKNPIHQLLPPKHLRGNWIKRDVGIVYAMPLLAVTLDSTLTYGATTPILCVCVVFSCRLKWLSGISCSSQRNFILLRRFAVNPLSFHYLGWFLFWFNIWNKSLLYI